MAEEEGLRPESTAVVQGEGEEARGLVFICKSFDELSTRELYAILFLRCAVFVNEQKHIFAEVDNNDQSAHHLCGFIGDELVAYCRIFGPGYYQGQVGALSRVATATSHRGAGHGRALRYDRSR